MIPTANAQRMWSSHLRWALLFYYNSYQMNSNKNADAVTYCKPVVWNNGNARLTPVLINGKPHFVADEVCKLLGLTSPTVSVKKLDGNEKLLRSIFWAGQKRLVNLVNESGLCHLVFCSRKPQAIAIRKWIISEVLPMLRKTILSVKPSNK